MFRKVITAVALLALVGVFVTVAGVQLRDFHGYEISPDGIYCRRRLQLAPEIQRSLEIGNLIARIHHPTIADPRQTQSRAGPDSGAQASPLRSRRPPDD